MFTWKKIGHVFNPKNHQQDWMHSYAQCPSAVIFDDFVRVFFSCRPEKDQNNQYVSNIAFVDLDRNNLQEIVNMAKNPLMPLGELGTFDEFAIYPTSVFSHGDKLLMYYAGWTRQQSTPYTCSIGLAISYDNGVSFKRYSKGPILTKSANEPFELSGPKIKIINTLYFMYYLAGEKWVKFEDKVESVYKIRLATSKDGINWHKRNVNMIPPVLPEDECQAGPDVIFLNDRYHMFFTYRYAHDFKNKERGYKIGYAYSFDAINWKRDDSQVGIRLSETGWDSEMMHYPHVFELDGKVYMIYNGNNFGEEGFGLAEMEGSA